MITGSLGRACDLDQGLNPFRPGISISSVITSGFNCGILARAIAPLEAIPATSTSGLEARASHNSLRTPRNRRRSVPNRRHGYSLFCCSGGYASAASAGSVERDHSAYELAGRPSPSRPRLRRMPGLGIVDLELRNQVL